MRIPKWFTIRSGMFVASAIVASATLAVSGVAAANAATGEVPVSTAAAKIATTLYLSPPQLTVTPQQSYAVLSGQLYEAKKSPHPFAAVRSVTVFLERRFPHGQWHIIQHKRTNSAGLVKFRVNLATGTSPSFRLLFRGTAKYRRAVSNVQSA